MTPTDNLRALASDTIVQMERPQEENAQIFPIGQNLSKALSRRRGVTIAGQEKPREWIGVYSTGNGVTLAPMASPKRSKKPSMTFWAELPMMALPSRMICPDAPP